MSSVYIYDFAANAWSSGPSLPAARGAASGASEYGLFWVNGGQDVSANYTATNESLSAPGVIP